MINDHASRTEHDHISRAEHQRITRKNLIYSLATGLVIGIIAGAPLGWFAHRFYYQQRAGQVLLCRQKHIGQPEVELKALCGSLNF
jgi:F0F1-type ATP synthase assembly protein I